MKYLVNLDLSKNELQNARVQNLGVAPSSPVEGQIYYDTGPNSLYFWDGADWIAMGSTGSGASTALDNLTSVAINTTLVSDTNNTDDLGTSSIMWRTGYFATSIELGHATANTLTASGGILSCEGVAQVNLSASQTLTNKTLTSPVIGGSPTAAGATWTDLGTVTTADINGGTLDGVVIGGTSAAAATVTTLTVNTNANPDANDGAALGTTALGWSDLHLAAGGVINWANGEITLTETDANTLTLAGGNFNATGNVVIDGDLTVSGTTVTMDTSTLTVEDPLVKLAKNNDSTDAVDIGLFGLYDTSGSLDLYSGLFRDATDGKWKLFRDLQAEPTTTVNTAGTGYTLATLVLGSIELGSESDTTITRVSGGVIAVEGVTLTRKYATDIGDNSSTSITVTHNLGTRDVTVAVYQATSTYDKVVCDVLHATTNTVTLVFAVAPTTNQYRCVVVG